MDCLAQVYYTTTPNKLLSQWESQFVDNNKLTTITDESITDGPSVTSRLTQFTQ